MRIVRQRGDGRGVRVAMLRRVDRIGMMVTVVVVGDGNGRVRILVLGVSIYIYIFFFSFFVSFLS